MQWSIENKRLTNYFTINLWNQFIVMRFFEIRINQNIVQDFSEAMLRETLIICKNVKLLTTISHQRQKNADQLCLEKHT